MSPRRRRRRRHARLLLLLRFLYSLDWRASSATD